MNSSESFDLYSRYYDLLYKDKATEDECKYIINLLHEYNVPGKNWIEFGSGSGRHGKVFKTLGISWKGIDRSEAMAKEGQKKGLQIQVGDIGKTIKLSSSQDAVLALFHVISYLTTNNEVFIAFKNAADCLKPGGLFIFDVWYSPAVLTQLPEERIKEVESDGLKVIRKARPTIDWNRNTVNVHYDIMVKDKQTNETQSFSEDHLMRHFSLPELEYLAQFAGFDFLHVEEWMSQSTISKDTWGVCCVLKKRRKI